MKEIPLTNSDLLVKVDDDAYELLRQVKWYLNGDGYAAGINSRKFAGVFGLGWPHAPLMHRILRLLPDGPEIDHRDKDRLNNQKHNLREASKSQNQMNSRSRPGTSIFKGVCWDSRDRCWRSTIVLDGAQTYLGAYSSEPAAARVYDRAARHLFGEFALLNFPAEISGAYVLWRTPVKSATGYIGVTFGGRGYVTSHLQGQKRIHLGVFDTAYDAAVYRDYYLNKHNLPGRRNFEL